MMTEQNRTVYTPIELLVLAEVGRYGTGHWGDHSYRKKEVAEEAKHQPIRNLVDAGLLELFDDPKSNFIKCSLTSRGVCLYESLITHFLKNLGGT